MKKWSKTPGGIFYAEELDEICALHETLRLEGFLTLVGWPEDDPEDVRVHFSPRKNLIVNLGRESVLQLASYTARSVAAPNRDLGTLGVGTGSSNGSLTPSSSTTALYNELTDGTPARYSLVHSFGDVTTPHVLSLWTAQVPAGDLVGSTINEAALFSRDGSMFAMRTFADQAKTSGYVLEFRWTIAY